MRKVYVIIVTYNAMRWIRRCLSSLRSSKYPCHIIIIDNCSTDGTIDYLSSQSDVHLILNRENRGFGQANNQGIEYAYNHCADYFFLLNQDAYIHIDTIEKLIETHQIHHEVGILAPIHLNGDGTRLDSYFRDYVLPTSEDFLTDAAIGQMKRHYVVNMVPAAGWFIPRLTIERIGGFDPLFFHYGEDDHYMSRLSYHQMVIIMDREAFVQHDRVGTVGNSSVYLRKKNRRDLLLLISDINLQKSFIIQKLGKQFFANLSLNLFYILSGKFAKVWNFWGDYWCLVRKKNQIVYSRHLNKRINHNWLTL